MDNREFRTIIQHIVGVLRAIHFVLAILLLLTLALYIDRFPFDLPEKNSLATHVPSESILPRISKSVLEETDLVQAEGVELVIKNCTSCHSAQLIIQNRMSLESWESTIVWMQQTQNLWNLGDDQPQILRYLAENYAPTKKGRREQLTEIEWYELP